MNDHPLAFLEAKTMLSGFPQSELGALQIQKYLAMLDPWDLQTVDQEGYWDPHPLICLPQSDWLRGLPGGKRIGYVKALEVQSLGYAKAAILPVSALGSQKLTWFNPFRMIWEPVGLATMAPGFIRYVGWTNRLPSRSTAFATIRTGDPIASKRWFYISGVGAVRLWGVELERSKTDLTPLAKNKPWLKENK